MKIDLKAFKEDKDYIEFEEMPDSLDFKVDGMEFTDPIRLKLYVFRSGGNYICEGKVKTQFSFECSRCLIKYTRPVESEIKFVLKEEKDQIVFESEGGENLMEGGRFFNLNSLVREGLILSLPLKPLCMENCKGLCPSCGANLNRTACKCKKEVEDPRWYKLKNLKIENKNKE